MKKKKPKPAEIARIVFPQADGTTISQPLVETALACIRQWVQVERFEVVTEDDWLNRESARTKLRRVAELAVNAELGLFISAKGGQKGGKAGSNSKATPILAEADKREKITTATISAIARKTGASLRTVRDTLTEAGKYTPRKKSGK